MCITAGCADFEGPGLNGCPGLDDSGPGLVDIKPGKPECKPGLAVCGLALDDDEPGFDDC